MENGTCTYKNVKCCYETCHFYPLKMRLITMKKCTIKYVTLKIYTMKVVYDKIIQYIVQEKNDVIMSLRS